MSHVHAKVERNTKDVVVSEFRSLRLYQLEGYKEMKITDNFKLVWKFQWYNVNMIFKK